MHSTDINHLSELKLKKAKNYMEESKIRLIAHKNNISSILEKYWLMLLKINFYKGYLESTSFNNLQ